MEATTNPVVTEKASQVNNTQAVTAKPDTSTAALLSLLAKHLQSGILSDAETAQLGKSAASESKAHRQSDNKDEKVTASAQNITDDVATASDQTEDESADASSSSTSSSSTTSSSSSSNPLAKQPLTNDQSQELQNDLQAVQSIATTLTKFNDLTQAALLADLKKDISGTSCSTVSALMDQLTSLAKDTGDATLISGVAKIEDNNLMTILSSEGISATFCTVLNDAEIAKGLDSSALTLFWDAYPGAEANKAAISSIIDNGGIESLASDLSNAVSDAWTDAENYFPGQASSSTELSFQFMNDMQTLQDVVKDLSSSNFKAASDEITNAGFSSLEDLLTATQTLAKDTGDTSLIDDISELSSNAVIQLMMEVGGSNMEGVVLLAEALKADPKAAQYMGDVTDYTKYKAFIDALNNAGGFTKCVSELSTLFDTAWSAAKPYFSTTKPSSNSGSTPNSGSNPSTNSGSSTSGKQLEYGEMLSFSELFMIMATLMNSEETNEAADASLATFLAKLESKVVSDMANKLNSFYNDNIANQTKASEINKATAQLNLYKSEWDNFQSQIDSNVQNMTNAAGTVDVNEVETTSDFESDILQTWGNVANQIAEI